MDDSIFTSIVKVCEATKVSLHLRCCVTIIVIVLSATLADGADDEATEVQTIIVPSQKYRTNGNIKKIQF